MSEREIQKGIDPDGVKYTIVLDRLGNPQKFREYGGKELTDDTPETPLEKLGAEIAKGSGTSQILKAKPEKRARGIRRSKTESQDKKSEGQV